MCTVAATTCAAGSMFCMFGNTCVDSTLACTASPVSAPSTPNVDYTIIGQYSTTATGSLKWSTYTPASPINVLPGDTIGFATTNTACIATRSLAVNEIVDLQMPAPAGTSVGTTLSTSSSAPGKYVMRAIAVQQSNTILYQTFTTSANYTATLTVNSMRITNTLTQTVTVTAEIPINNTILSVVVAAATGSPVNIQILPHQGALRIRCLPLHLYKHKCVEVFLSILLIITATGNNVVFIH
jgi:hypothetical protein